VKPVHGDAEPADKEPLWLVMEWLDGEAKPTKFALTTLLRRMSKKQIIRIIKERWRTEKAYEELKEELGLDHFEGRSFTGWHHHTSVVLCCYAFIVTERMRHFPDTHSSVVPLGALPAAHRLCREAMSSSSSSPNPALRPTAEPDRRRCAQGCDKRCQISWLIARVPT
jgi:hypothetical protein